MKLFKKSLILGITFGAALFSAGADSRVQANSIEASCGYNINERVNPDFKTMNCLLTKTALEHDVPPEIVKGVAEGESGGWRHFDNSGNPIITSDNGIGVMQITNQSGYDVEQLKWNVAYNIKAGVEILDKMFKRTDLPKINNGDRDILENWYFAIMAYNGTKPVNSPIVQSTGEVNTGAYQEKIIRKIKEHNLIDLTTLPFAKSEFEYDPNSSQNIVFKQLNYHFKLPLTKTKHQFTTGQKVETTDAKVKLRQRPTTNSSTITELNLGEVLTITGPFVYEESNSSNHFVWYPVKRSNGTTGYIAGSFLSLRFKDVPEGHYAQEEIKYLVDRSILKGIGNDNFGLERPLTRWQAVLLITRANNVPIGNSPDPGFTDVPKSHLYYEEIAAAVEAGLFKGVSDNKFNPDATLKRSEMAVVLQRLYQFPPATKQHPFTDVTQSWYSDEVARLYSSGITDGMNKKTTYEPATKVSREQFAVFMVRSMDENFRLK